MIVKKLAIRPIRPKSARISAANPSPKMPMNPSNSGVPEIPMTPAPPSTPLLSSRMRAPVITSVCMPQIVPLGTSRAGSIDSSAASGISSIAR